MVTGESKGKKKVLILGGSSFIGRTLVEKLIKTDQYELCLFNRGLTNSELFPSIARIIGSRETDDIQQIAPTQWDYIIDVSCYYPADLKAVLNQIKYPLNRYIFISTCSVYDNEKQALKLSSEEAPILRCSAEQANDREASSYGNRKAECERILQSSGQGYSILRPSLVYGPYDSSDRFYYWLYQVKNNLPLIVPDHGETKFSITYVEDLVNIILLSLNDETSADIYNCISFTEISIREIIESTQEILQKNNKEFIFSSQTLKEQNLKPWMDLALWLDVDYFSFSNQKLKDDLNPSLTKFKESLLATISYFDSKDWPTPTYGMSDKKKLDLIQRLSEIN